MTRRRWIADHWMDTTATLSGDQAHHLFRVLRAQTGMEFDVVAGERVWRSVITDASESSVEFRLIEELPAGSSPPITVLMSIFKFDRMEWAIEKLTELGVARIEPVVARRTEKHLSQAATKRVERWRRIAVEAAKQSRRSNILQVGDPCSLSDGLKSTHAMTSRYVLAEEERQQTLFGALQLQSSADEQRIILAVGPEGGWTPDEQAMFKEYGWTAVSLGNTILRAETAAIAAAAITTAWLNR